MQVENQKKIKTEKSQKTRVYAQKPRLKMPLRIPSRNTMLLAKKKLPSADTNTKSLDEDTMEMTVSIPLKKLGGRKNYGEGIN